jgi:glycerol kinase
MEYFASIDQGTTSTRFAIFDSEENQVAIHQIEIEQIYPLPNYVEHNPNEIWESVKTCISEVGKKFDLNKLSSIGITNQRETTVAWSKSTGMPLYNAIVWQDTRTQDICDEITEIDELKSHFKNTGLPVATYFSLSKILWLLRNVEDVKVAAKTDDLCFGTIDSWILYKLTGKHLTDVTNASRTLLFELQTLSWNPKIIDYFDIPESSLPEVKPSMSYFAENTSFVENVPITAVLGDQQASLFGHKAFKTGDSKNTYGTGCFLLVNTGHNIISSKNGLISTVGYQIENQPPVYALEGSVAVAGSSIQWLRDNIGLINKSSDVEKLALLVKDNGGVYFVPAFSGLFSPHWDPTARGTIVGMSGHTNKSHIARAVLESVGFQNDELIKAFELDLNLKLSSISVDGGMTTNNLLMQFQSDISDINIQSLEIKEVTAYGAALASFTFIKQTPLESIVNKVSKSQTWSPNMNGNLRENYLSRWNKAIEKAKNWM